MEAESNLKILRVKAVPGAIALIKYKRGNESNGEAIAHSSENQ
ncbi:hypothetical protein [Nostoc sp. UHCC 0926]|nr:hypothetical protein [Nostoc sp. UHCC 0926]